MYFRIQFAPGANSNVVNGTVIMGERHTYILGACGGQTMILNISSLEANAVFDLYSPSGMLMLQETTDWSGVLPEDGDYQVIVGGTRGNATYTMQVQIY